MIVWNYFKYVNALLAIGGEINYSVIHNDSNWCKMSHVWFVFQENGVLDGSGHHLQTREPRATPLEEASSTHRSFSAVQVSLDVQPSAIPTVATSSEAKTRRKRNAPIDFDLEFAALSSAEYATVSKIDQKNNSLSGPRNYFAFSLLPPPLAPRILSPRTEWGRGVRASKTDIRRHGNRRIPASRPWQRSAQALRGNGAPWYGGMANCGEEGALARCALLSVCCWAPARFFMKLLGGLSIPSVGTYLPFDLQDLSFIPTFTVEVPFGNLKT